MDIVDIFTDLHKEIELQLKQIQDTYMDGQLRDMEHHKFLQGQLLQLYNMQDFMKSYNKEE
jgi:hypothetical protein|tara:strand:+ start:424 stop:606 length:183 start_codon:yes stop_codon:yes gene_type:complete